MTASHRADAPGADGYFDELVAATYDDDDDEMFAPQAIDPVVDVLAELAGGGRALELAIGTGRIALPLARRGVEVHGIELSRAMVARLRAKPGGDAIPVTIGDMATDPSGRDVLRGLPGVQHDHEPDQRRMPRSPAFATPPRTWSPAAASSSRSAFPTCGGCRRARTRGLRM